MRKIILGLALAGVLANIHGEGFADHIVSYTPGTDASLTDPNSALGEPSRNTPGDFGGPVDPFNAPYLGEQVVSIGAGGSLTVQFDTPIANEPSNPYGLDFNIFGNSGFVIINGDYTGGGITDGSLYGSNEGGFTRVSISSDGLNYYQLDTALAPTVDQLFPTDGAGEFHISVDPSLGNASFDGLGIDGIRALYGGSGGGAGFDISWARDSQGQPVELDSIRFVRVDVVSGICEIDGFAAVLGSSAPGVAQTTREEFSNPPASWSIFGDATLFQWNSEAKNLEVTWDSSRPNSYFYLPLPVKLTDMDDFQISFTLRLADIAIGVDPAKPDTFEIAAGLINTTNAFAAGMYRGSGINPDHGPRNIVEWDYFPDSGFGATLGPTVATASNQIAFSDNHPLELSPGISYFFELSYSATNRTLSSRLSSDGQSASALKDLVLPANFTNFAVNAFAISSYNDAGQTPPQFAGSILAHGAVDDVAITIFHHPELRITSNGGEVRLNFESEAGWSYQLESSVDLRSWQSEGEALEGTGNPIELAPALDEGARFFRIEARR
jgi:hypothetical protein